MLGFGWRLDVLKKRKPNAPSNKVLGAHLDVSGVHTAAASATAEPDADTAELGAASADLCQRPFCVLIFSVFCAGLFTSAKLGRQARPS